MSVEFSFDRCDGGLAHVTIGSASPTVISPASI
jgi:hypothetical protein